MRNWDLDGFKLDFVDWFDAAKCENADAEEGMDHVLVADATHRLLTDLTNRLRAIKPDVIIEFRQPYIGPAMRRYANMFRAVDCPNDSHTNRVNTIDLRLLGGRTAIHSDMFMWHLDEPAESAAMQLLNVLFSVPQVSVRIAELPADHREMLRFWLAFWRENREVLLDGRFEPRQPALWYPTVVASTAAKRIVVVYARTLAEVGPDVPVELSIANATRDECVVIELADDIGTRRVSTFDCCGQPIHSERRDMVAGLHTIAVPPAGLARITA